jgi:hypothetical protein
MSRHHLRKAQRRWGLLSAIVICTECMMGSRRSLIPEQRCRCMQGQLVLLLL